jgi:hypothetical protein
MTIGDNYLSPQQGFFSYTKLCIAAIVLKEYFVAIFLGPL